MTNQLTQTVECIPEEQTVLGFKPENNSESVNSLSDEKNSALDSPSRIGPEKQLMEFKPETALPAEPIIAQLKEHQATADWDKQALVEELHKWVERFILEFKLKTSRPAIKIDRLARKCCGHYQPGRNGFGLHNEIAINETYIDSRKFWQTLGTLLHELLHAEQEQTGKPGKYNYHNKAFIKKAGSLGLTVDQWGHTEYKPAPSPFWDILGKHGVTAPDLSDIQEQAVPSDKSGNSKLKLWVCECTPKPVHVRVAIKDFEAICLNCKAMFRQKLS